MLPADREIGDREQQEIAREIDLSETAFIFGGKQPDGSCRVRIRTPRTGEVPFAGHPTPGTTHVIHRFPEHGQTSRVTLSRKAGRIPVDIAPEGLTMRQDPPVFGEVIDRAEIAAVFGLDPGDVREDHPVRWVTTGPEPVPIPLKIREALKRPVTDRQAFARYVLRHPKNRCSHLFFADTGHDTFAARCLMEDFEEDPATGSANGCLPEHGYFGARDIRYTVVRGEDMGRRSVLRIHGVKRNGEWTVEVGGQCHTVARGDWG